MAVSSSIVGVKAEAFLLELIRSPRAARANSCLFNLAQAIAVLGDEFSLAPSSMCLAKVCASRCARPEHLLSKHLCPRRFRKSGKHPNDTKREIFRPITKIFFIFLHSDFSLYSRPSGVTNCRRLRRVLRNCVFRLCARGRGLSLRYRSSLSSALQSGLRSSSEPVSRSE